MCKKIKFKIKEYYFKMLSQQCQGLDEKGKKVLYVSADSKPLATGTFGSIYNACNTNTNDCNYVIKQVNSKFNEPLVEIGGEEEEEELTTGPTLQEEYDTLEYIGGDIGPKLYGHQDSDTTKESCYVMEQLKYTFFDDLLVLSPAQDELIKNTEFCKSKTTNKYLNCDIYEPKYFLMNDGRTASNNIITELLSRDNFLDTVLQTRLRFLKIALLVRLLKQLHTKGLIHGDPQLINFMRWGDITEGFKKLLSSDDRIDTISDIKLEFGYKVIDVMLRDRNAIVPGTKIDDKETKIVLEDIYGILSRVKTLYGVYFFSRLLELNKKDITLDECCTALYTENRNNWINTFLYNITYETTDYQLLLLTKELIVNENQTELHVNRFGKKVNRKSKKSKKVKRKSKNGKKTRKSNKKSKGRK
jgi:hypothetical protein